MLRHWMLSCATALLALAACTKTADVRTPAQWQHMARTDLDAAHALIMAAHPGAIDAQNPGFRAAAQAAYSEALASIGRVDNYDSALSAVRIYVTSFRDGHLSYSDERRPRTATAPFAGWRIAYRDGKFLVAATVADWPAPQPAPGAQLLACDGKPAMALYEQQVAPFNDRRAQAIEQAAPDLAFAWFSDLKYKQCRFSEGGKAVDYRVVYQQWRYQDVEKYFSHVARQAPVARDNGYWLRDGTLWIRAANFSLQEGTPQAAELEKMRKELTHIRGVQRIVFDARGNGGGDSRIGGMLFDAATGGLDTGMSDADLAKLPHTFAQWRVSPFSIEHTSKYIAHAVALFGKDSAQAADAQGFADELRAAGAAAQPWVTQPGGPRVSALDVARHHGKLRAYPAGVTVALVTDAACASACLDFADTVRMVPGARHLGRTTSADTVYIDIGWTSLPSGNKLILPLKVWRNRLRGNNQPWVPDTVLKVEMNDDAAVEAATIGALATPAR